MVKCDMTGSQLDGHLYYIIYIVYIAGTATCQL